MQPRPPRQPDRRPHQPDVATPGDFRDDRLFLGGALIADLEVLEPVADGLGEVAGGDVLRRVLRRHDLEPFGGAHLPEVRHLHQPLVERGQQQVLRGLGQAVQLVQEEDTPLAHGPHQRSRDEGLLAVAAREDQRRVEPAGEATLGEAVVAVHAHRLAAEGVADGERERRLARAHRPLQQQVPAAGEHRVRGGHLLRASDHGDRPVARSAGQEPASGRPFGSAAGRRRPRSSRLPATSIRARLPAGRSARSSGHPAEM